MWPFKKKTIEISLLDIKGIEHKQESIFLQFRPRAPHELNRADVVGSDIDIKLVIAGKCGYLTKCFSGDILEIYNLKIK